MQRLLEDDDREQCEREGERQRQENRDRVQPRFELGGQNEIHEHQRQQEREHEILRRASELTRSAGESTGVLGAAVHLAELRENGILNLRLRRGRQQVAEHSHLTLPRKPVDVRRCGARLKIGDVVERDAVGRIHGLDVGERA